MCSAGVKKAAWFEVYKNIFLSQNIPGQVHRGQAAQFLNTAKISFLFWITGHQSTLPLLAVCFLTETIWRHAQLSTGRRIGTSPYRNPLPFPLPVKTVAPVALDCLQSYKGLVFHADCHF